MVVSLYFHAVLFTICFLLAASNQFTLPSECDYSLREKINWQGRKPFKLKPVVLRETMYPLPY